MRVSAPFIQPQAPQMAVSAKEPFDIQLAVRQLRRVVRNFRPAMLFALYDEGYKTPFEILVACVVSIRTLDEVSLVAARHLFEKARTPQELADLGVEGIDQRIGKATFHYQKARSLYELSQILLKDHGGELPHDEQIVRALPGIGPKCSNLVLGITGVQPRIGVDIHVHRVTNRWGYVAAGTTDRTLDQLEQKLPKKFWVEINRLLVPFGKHVCTGVRPRCSSCPLLNMCQQVGVEDPR